MRRETVVRVGLDVLALLIVLALLWFGFVVWTRSYNGEVAYECVVLKQCGPSVQPSK